MNDKLLIDRTLLEQALKCLETPIHEQPLGMRTQTASAFRAALAQQPEPAQAPEEFDHGVGADRFKVVRGAFWWHILIGDSPTRRGKFRSPAAAEEMVGLLLREFRNGAFVQHSTHPPQRPPLTDEEMLDIIDDAFEGASLLDVARAIERKVRGE